MASNESWVTETVKEFQNALLCRFREEKAIQLILRNLLKLRQSENNKLRLDLIALWRDLKILSDKLIVKQCVQLIFTIVIRKAEFNAKLLMAANLTC